MISKEEKKRTFGEGIATGIIGTAILCLVMAALFTSCTEYECVTPIPTEQADTTEDMAAAAAWHPAEGSMVWIGGNAYPVIYTAGRPAVDFGRNYPRASWFLHPAEVVTGMSLRRGFPMYAIPRVQQGDYPDIMFGQYLLGFESLRPQTLRYYPETAEDYDSIVVRTSNYCTGTKDMGSNCTYWTIDRHKSAVLIGEGWLTLAADCGRIEGEVWKNGEIIENL